MPRRRKKSTRINERIRFKDDLPVVMDVKYWLMHALHWHALLVAVIAVLVVGRTYFNASP